MRGHTSLIRDLEKLLLAAELHAPGVQLLKGPRGRDTEGQARKMLL
jgi:hypothetical protein